MFNTMTVTKVGGALAGALLIFLLINWASDVIYSTESKNGEAEAAYLIEVETDGEAAPTEVTASSGPNVAELVAAADSAKGSKTFSKCKACHKITAGKNFVGPSLFGVVDREKASLAGFSYSKALVAKGGSWTLADLNSFLIKPKDFVPGTKMGFAGIKKDQTRINLIAYLATLTN